ncbi:Yip1 domain family protein [Pleurostoma richardsiae]|uniref:Protein YIP n=1 Tax=Pleurostoma richardsiae TaxID=41990 RepID=A0AA38RTW5_9PEZI|nr:Yip1 domain family protein [Pleurostoma richardsiae]
MSQYYGAPNSNPAYAAASPQNLQFYQSTYSPGVPGRATPSQGSYGYGGPSSGGYGGAAGFNSGFGPAAGVSGRMGEQGGLRTGWIAAFSTEGYDGEPPLLEELGVNFDHIRAKTLAVLNPFQRIDQHLMDDSDLAGPIIFFLAFGFFLLFSGKVHFGYIYGLALLGSIALHCILSLMSPSDAPTPVSQSSSGPPYSSPTPSYPENPATAGGPSSQAGGDGSKPQHLSSTLTFPRSASILGYCLLPLVTTSLVGVVMPMDTPLGIVMTIAAIMWSVYSASGMFCAVARMRGMRGLVAYPLALFYVGFGIMAVFSSRGSGSMGGLRG